ncbi:hypothetical protein O0L34_g10996 [Tuta absoluta]|nr:hypothetical protein O0L34_g10996 [Tuta absoluta]
MSLGCNQSLTKLHAPHEFNVPLFPVGPAERSRGSAEPRLLLLRVATQQRRCRLDVINQSLTKLHAPHEFNIPLFPVGPAERSRGSAEPGFLLLRVATQQRRCRLDVINQSLTKLHAPHEFNIPLFPVGPAERSRGSAEPRLLLLRVATQQRRCRLDVINQSLTKLHAPHEFNVPLFPVGPAERSRGSAEPGFLLLRVATQQRRCRLDVINQSLTKLHAPHEFNIPLFPVGPAERSRGSAEPGFLLLRVATQQRRCRLDVINQSITHQTACSS